MGFRFVIVFVKYIGYNIILVRYFIFKWKIMFIINKKKDSNVCSFSI